MVALYLYGTGSRVECYARAVNTEGEAGKELASPVVTVDSQSGICPHRKPGYHTAEPFSARLWYTGEQSSVLHSGFEV